MGQARALAYAEDKLGVHRTAVALESVTENLQRLYADAAGYESTARRINWEIEVRKNQILVEVSTANSDQGPTAIERLVRLAYAGDEELGLLNSQLMNTMGARDSINASIRGAEADHKARVARLNELGGYFHYLAAIKDEQTAATYTSSQDYQF